MTERHALDSFWVGLLAGVVGMACGCTLLGLAWVSANGTSLSYFYQEIVLDSNFYRDSVLTSGTLFNLVLCWVANRRGWERMGQGLLAVVLPMVPLIVYFQMSSGTGW